jgi:hypothetical protein
LKPPVNVFPRALRALILLLSTDVKKFFRTIKEISCKFGRELSDYLGHDVRVERRVPSGKGFPLKLIKAQPSDEPTLTSAANLRPDDLSFK